MTIHLSKELAQFVRDAVHAGRYVSEDEVIGDALIRLQQAIDLPRPTPRPIGEAELHQRMLEMGLLSQLPAADAEFDDPDDEPITIAGAPMSETVIQDRR